MSIKSAESHFPETQIKYFFEKKKKRQKLSKLKKYPYKISFVLIEKLLTQASHRWPKPGATNAQVTVEESKLCALLLLMSMAGSGGTTSTKNGFNTPCKHEKAPTTPLPNNNFAIFQVPPCWNRGWLICLILQTKMSFLEANRGNRSIYIWVSHRSVVF